MSPFPVSEIAPRVHLCRVGLEASGSDRDPASRAAFRDWLAPEESESLRGFKSRQRRAEWLAGRLAVKTLVRTFLDAELAPVDITVARGLRGAPFLPLFPEHCVSITHAGGHAVAALALDPALAVGIDLERRTIPGGRTFPDRAFSLREQAAARRSAAPSPAMVWVLKEAYLKYLRQGLRHGLRRVEFVRGELLDDGRPAPVRWTVDETPPGYLLGVVHGARPAPGPD